MQVHQVGEALLAARDRFSQCYCGVVAALDDHALDEVLDANLHARLHEGP